MAIQRLFYPATYFFEKDDLGFVSKVRTFFSKLNWLSTDFDHPPTHPLKLNPDPARKNSDFVFSQIKWGFDHPPTILSQSSLEKNVWTFETTPY